MISKAQQTAKHFLIKHKLSVITLNDLKRIIEAQGYTIVFFNPVDNDPDVAMLIKIYHLENYVSHCKAFTYADSRNRLVFVHEGLSEEETLTVLAHEEGHISCEHLSGGSIIGQDVVFEKEANEFAQYICNPPFSFRIKRYVVRNKLKLIAVGAALVVIAVSLSVVLFAINEGKYYKNYYIVPTGHKYHVKGCGLIANSHERRLTKAEYETGEYTPCVRCIKDAD